MSDRLCRTGISLHAPRMTLYMIGCLSCKQICHYLMIKIWKKQPGARIESSLYNPQKETQVMNILIITRWSNFLSKLCF